MGSQCGILFIGPCGKDTARIEALRSLGFRVDESADVPAAEEITAYHAVIVRPDIRASLAVVGTRLRARPHFGRRLLLALVRGDVSDRDKRDARLCGFDQTLPDNCTPRDLAAYIIRVLRAFPEFRCLLRAPNGRRKAA